MSPTSYLTAPPRGVVEFYQRTAGLPRASFKRLGTGFLSGAGVLRRTRAGWGPAVSLGPALAGGPCPSPALPLPVSISGRGLAGRGRARRRRARCVTAAGGGPGRAGRHGTAGALAQRLAPGGRPGRRSGPGVARRRHGIHVRAFLTAVGGHQHRPAGFTMADLAPRSLPRRRGIGSPARFRQGPAGSATRVPEPG